MTSSAATQAMFSLTPPPSDLDEIDKASSSLFVCSPPLAAFTYPSPAPSHSGRVSLSDSAHSSSRDSMQFPDGCHPPTANDFFFGTAQSSDSFLSSVSTWSEQQEITQFQANTQAYDLFQQNSWMPFSSYPHQAHPLASYAQQQQEQQQQPHLSSSYPELETQIPPSSFPNVIPPTPQDIAPVSFDLSNLSRATPPQRGLSTSSTFSLHSSAPSTFSVSRSPSPVTFQTAPTASGNTGRSTTLRSNSTTSTSNSLHAYGIPVTDSSSGTSQPAWRCAYPGCTSRATFTRGCDLRKHYNRHSKHLFCRMDGCPQSQAASLSRSKDGALTGGFSSKKDRARHEAKHNPGIKCEWKGPNGEECGRVFSRMDNMKDHVRRIHKKQEQKLQAS